VKDIWTVRENNIERENRGSQRRRETERVRETEIKKEIVRPSERYSKVSTETETGRQR